MKRKKDAYLAGLEHRRQRAAQGGGEEALDAPPVPSTKPVEQMSESELDQALLDAKRDLVRLERAEVSRRREDLAGGRAIGGGKGSVRSALAAFLQSQDRRRRAPWK